MGRKEKKEKQTKFSFQCCQWNKATTIVFFFLFLWVGCSLDSDVCVCVCMYEENSEEDKTMVTICI